MKVPTRQEEICLLAVWKLQDNAYGVQIKKKVEEMTGRRLSYGALYFTLEQITNKKYVERTVGEPTPVRGGCSKIYYHVTRHGMEALKAAYELEQSIWKDVCLTSPDRRKTT
jgi:DNA-binding PadR family transcriptional regulator